MKNGAVNNFPPFTRSFYAKNSSSLHLLIFQRSHKGHAACKLAEELVKPLLCCLLETLLKVPQPKHGG